MRTHKIEMNTLCFSKHTKRRASLLSLYKGRNRLAPSPPSPSGSDQVTSIQAFAHGLARREDNPYFPGALLIAVNKLNCCSVVTVAVFYREH